MPSRVTGFLSSVLLASGVLLFFAGCSDDSPSAPGSDPPDDQIPHETVDAEVTAISVSPIDPNVLYSTSTKEVWSLDPATGEERMILSGQIFRNSEGFERLAIIPRETAGAAPDYLIVGRTGEGLGVLPREFEGGSLRVFGHDRAVYSDGRGLVVLDWASGAILGRVEARDRVWLYSVALSPDEGSLAYSVYEPDAEDGSQHEVRILDLESGSTSSFWDGAASGMRWSSDGIHLGFATYNGTSWQVFLFEPGSGAEPEQVSDAEHTIDLAWSPDGSRFVCRDRDRLLVYDVEGNGIASLERDVELREPVTFGPNGQTLLHGGAGIDEIDLATGEVRELVAARRLALYPSGAEVAQLGIRFEFETDKAEYRPGEAAVLTFRLRNDGEQPVRFEFANIQQFGITATAGDQRLDYPGFRNPALSEFLLALGEVREYVVELDFRESRYGGFGPGSLYLEGYLLDGRSPRIERVIELLEGR